MVKRTLATSTRIHATKAELLTDIHRVVQAKHQGEAADLTDSSALAIAALWQSPGIDGQAFAELANTGSVSLDDLFLDIVEQMCRNRDTNVDVLDLVMLMFWAHSHPSLATDEED